MKKAKQRKHLPRAYVRDEGPLDGNQRKEIQDLANKNAPKGKLIRTEKLLK